MIAEERVIFDEVNAALAAEQREHDITRRQRDTLQTQCEDMQSEMETETKLNNASLNPRTKVLQQEQDDEMACMAEEVMSLKSTLKRSHELAESVADTNGELTQKIEALELVEVAIRTDVSRLEGYKVELEDSAETQARHMQQVDAACKAAEAKVIEQRNDIEALKNDEDLWICPNVGYCESKCHHGEPHTHVYTCDTGDNDVVMCVKCVKVNTCKECATLREEIINRDAVILEQERKADRTDELMHTMLEQLKKLLGCVEIRKRITNGRRIIMSSELDTPELHQGYQPRANCVRQFAILFSGKAGERQTPTTKHACKWYNVCTIAYDTAYACTANEGQDCGRKREIDAKHGVRQ